MDVPGDARQGLRGARILIRADASARIGTGHLMRCLSLATVLRHVGANVRFACRDLPGLPGHRLSEAGFDLIRLPAGPEMTEPSAAWLDEAGAVDVVVVDHYGLDAAWEHAARRHGRLIVAIDDLADRPHDADILIDTTLGRIQAHYRGLVPDPCITLLGPTYALVDPRFPQARPVSLAYRATPGLAHLVVSLGGADPQGITAQVVRSLAQTTLPTPARITIVLGPAVTDRLAIEQAADHLSCQARVLSDVRDMPRLLSETDLVIGAGGGSAWERCCLGVPTLMLVLADNQAEGAAALAAAGAALLVGTPQDLPSALPRVMQQAARPSTLEALSRRASNLCDGLGASRVARILQEALGAPRCTT